METLAISDEPNIDIAEVGRIYGTELLNANEHLNADHLKTLVVVNQASGDSATLPLSFWRVCLFVRGASYYFEET